MEVAYRLRVTLSLTMNISDNFTSTLTLGFQFDPERPDQTVTNTVLMFVPFRDDGELLLPDEIPEQAQKQKPT